MLPYFCVFIKFVWHVIVDHDKSVASWIQSTSSYFKVHLNYTVFNTTAKLTITICHFTMCLLHVSAFTRPSSGRPQRKTVMANSVKDLRMRSPKCTVSIKIAKNILSID